MSTEYNNRDSNSAMSRHGTVTVTSPFGTQTYTSELERSTDFYRMTHELTVDDQRSIMSGKYSARKGEFNLDTPYIRYGQMKALNLEFNHDSNHVDATVAWAPTKKVYLRFPKSCKTMVPYQTCIECIIFINFTFVIV